MALGLRYLLLTGVLVGAVGIAGRFLAWPLLTSTVGPTAYVFAAHPRTEAARSRNALVGHAVASPAGSAPSPPSGSLSALRSARPDRPRCVGRRGNLGGGHNRFFCWSWSGHTTPPLAATALLITTGLAKPGAPVHRPGPGSGHRHRPGPAHRANPVRSACERRGPAPPPESHQPGTRPAVSATIRVDGSRR